MPDAQKRDLVDVDFVGGEQPDAYKLTGMISQLKLGLEAAYKAIGDIYGQQTFTSSASGSSYNLSRLPMVGPNLSRILGSAGWLNPKMVGRIRVTQEITFHGSYGISYEGWTIRGRREFRLPYPPIQITSAEGVYPITTTTSWDATDWNVDTDAASIMQNQQATLSAVDSTGDYYVSEDGVITTFDPLEAAETVVITYDFDTIPDCYDGASFNIIPDMNQPSVLCTAALVSGTSYTITLPTVGYLVGDGTAVGQKHLGHWVHRSYSSTPNEAMLSQQLVLPSVLTDNLTSGDTIPAGFIHLYDETAEEIIDGLTFLYRSTTSVESSGVALVASSNRYRLIVAGANAAETLYHLRRGHMIHNHSGKYLASNISDDPGVWTGEKISHVHLLDAIDVGTATKGGFTVSGAGPHRNPHPQYMHRYGYQYDEGVADGSTTTGNRNNAMLGDFVIAAATGNVAIASTYRLYFGSPSGPAFRFWYSVASSSQAHVEVEAYPLQAEEGLAAGLAAWTSSESGGTPIKWVYVIAADISNGGSFTMTGTTPSDFGIPVGGMLSIQSDSDSYYWFPSKYDSDDTDDPDYGNHMLQIDKVRDSAGTLQVVIRFGSNFNDNAARAVIFYI